VTTPQTSRCGPSGRGCYGLRLDGVDGAARLLIAAPADWPALEVVRAASDGHAPAQDTVGPDEATLPLQSGWVHVERHAARATFHVPGPPPDGDLVHPYLAPVAAVAARWAGRDSFHAGAVLAGGGAWGVLGDKETGKSTTLAWLALHGHDVLVDDLLVLDRGDALAGPRCIDLRAEPAARLGVGEALGVVGLRERWRLVLDAVPARVPLRGWITLEWADELALEPLRGSERLLALLPQLAVRLTPPAPEELVELSSHPVWRLRRPCRMDVLPELADRLAEVIYA
jgi:hypothetical protein